ncbi:hypothetical protein HU200_055897 [Digitaria exilis]|uniref:K-box domain-containing protein n=1 Tax=Digitaria exilis TaxID=1010633 RepID=A0A835E4N5_9POAL|nr:hypothetical protein HU200_055897 [Digitaria exilis]
MGCFGSPFALEVMHKEPAYVKATIERYKKANSDTSNSGTVAEVNAQHYQQESAKLRQTISSLQNSNRTIMGDAIHTMSLRDLKQLEGRLEKGISKIRARKNELLYAEVEYMQKREMDLQSDNMYLRSKVNTVVACSSEHKLLRHQTFKLNNH